MPLNLSNIRDYNPRQLIVQNLTDKTYSIGDLNIKLGKNGAPNDAIDLIKLNPITKKPLRSFDQIAGSLELELAVELSRVRLINEDGVISTSDNQIKASDPASLLNAGGTGTVGELAGFSQGSILFTGSSENVVENTHFYWDNTAERLEIGDLTSIPGVFIPGGAGPVARPSLTYLYEVNNSTGANIISSAATLVKTAPTSEANTAFIGSILTDHTSGTIVGQMIGSTGLAEHNGTSTSSDLMGLLGEVALTSSGDITQAVGVSGYVANTSVSGTISTGIAIKAEVGGVLVASPRTDKAYGLYVSRVASLSESWGIYVENGTNTADMNFIGGSGTKLQDKDTISPGSDVPNSSAVLELESDGKGLLLPRMTAAQGSAISSPANGLMIYVTDTNGTFTSIGFWGRENGSWVKL